MNKLLKIISIMVITGCSTTNNEYIIIEDMSPGGTDLAVTEIIKEKYTEY
jgi:hypothetical protein